MPNKHLTVMNYVEEGELPPPTGAAFLRVSFPLPELFRGFADLLEKAHEWEVPFDEETSARIVQMVEDMKSIAWCQAGGFKPEPGKGFVKVT